MKKIMFGYRELSEDKFSDNRGLYGFLYDPKKAQIIIIVISIVFLGLNMFYFVRFNAQILEHDAAYYYGIAKSISNGDGITFNGAPTIEFPVGYPLFLSLVFIVFGYKISTVIIVQIFLSLFTMFLLYKLTSFYVKSPVLRLLPVLMYAFNYKIMFFNAYVLSESFSLFLLFLMLYTLKLFFETDRPILLAVAGLLFGWLVLVRPVFQYGALLLVSIFLFFLLKKRTIKSAVSVALFYVSICVVIAPVLIYNNKNFGAYKIAFHGGMSLYQGTYLPYDGYWHNWGGRVVTENDGSVPEDIYQKIKYKSIKETDSILFKEGVENIKKNGVAGIPLYSKNLSILLTSVPTQKYGLIDSPIQVKFYFVSSALAMLLFFIFIYEYFLVEKRRDYFVIIIIILITYLIASHAIVSCDERYGFQPLALLYFIAPLSLEMVIKRKRNYVAVT